VCLVLICRPVSAAEHAKITLDVSTSKYKETAFVDQTPPDSGKNPRPVLHAKAGETIKVEWVFTNIYPHKTIENAILHFYVAKEAKVGQKELPDLGEKSGDVVVETAFEMDFKPNGRAKGRHSFKVDKPGAYLVRLETLKTDSDHEHFAAIDLVVDAEASK
jgi:hypothetical protein